MDDVPQKRPQPDESQSHASRSIILPKRPRSDQSTQPPVTSENGGRNVSACSTVNARKASPAQDDDDDDDDYTSSSGSSLSPSDDEDDNHSENAENPNSVLNGDNEEITSLPARRKPHIRRIDKEPGLLSRLSAFLPQMKTANEDLQKEIDAGRAKDIRLDEEDDHGDGQYIEMNLGLGVLEEKRPGDGQNPGDGEPKYSKPQSSAETNVLDHLMGREKTSPSDKPPIQDLGN